MRAMYQNRRPPRSDARGPFWGEDEGLLLLEALGLALHLEDDGRRGRALDLARLERGSAAAHGLDRGHGRHRAGAALRARALRVADLVAALEGAAELLALLELRLGAVEGVGVGLAQGL